MNSVIQEDHRKYCESHQPNKRCVCSNKSISILTLHYIVFTYVSLSQVETQGQKGYGMWSFQKKNLKIDST